MLDARALLGDDTVAAVLRRLRESARELVASVTSMSAPKLTILPGAGEGDAERTPARRGHLGLV
ncbi:MAG: hypothetical protein RL385_507 [Pseudomonadota bacterium]|jgi:predicted NBD/HSP70 family sugar kinase